ncbi:hypothetical protein QE454_002905 [Microbacterium sp. SORGH_AS454]|nr:hypothetical protein [Microbacterium sp. SORGH_AS_0454]
MGSAPGGVIGEGHGDARAQGLVDHVSHAVDGTRGDDDGGRSGRGAPRELRQELGDELAIAEARQTPRQLKARQQRRRLACGQARRALQTHRVRDGDHIVAIQQIPVDVEQVVGKLPVPPLAGQTNHGQTLDHRAHLFGSDLELRRGLGDRDLALTQEVGDELQQERGAVESGDGTVGAHAAPPWRASVASSRRMTSERRSAGSTTRTSGPYEASSSAKTCRSTYGT